MHMIDCSVDLSVKREPEDALMQSLSSLPMRSVCVRQTDINTAQLALNSFNMHM